ncbi:N-acetylmuramoyl-L-alanine amidase [Puteibacter caeruleilacunae]|nr:N-acetylmuramoyl-L-alanine amidase [Puteibacter caeruleilacunae]
MYIKNHRLMGDGITQMKCENKSIPLRSNNILVLHYTAGGSAYSSAQYLCRREIKRSAHCVVARDSSIFSLVDFNKVAYHAGVSEFNGLTNLNNHSLSIELANHGQLKTINGKYKTWYGKKVPSNEVYLYENPWNGEVTAWHKFTPQQLTKTMELCKLLIKQYDIKYIVAHSEINGQKSDTGMAFPLHNFATLTRTTH